MEADDIDRKRRNDDSGERGAAEGNQDEADGGGEIGQSIGAKKLDRVRKVLRTALFYACGIALTLGIVVAIFGRSIVGIFTQDLAVMEYALLYMRTVAFSYFFLAAMMVVAMAFQALGRSWPGFWIFFLCFLVISLPLSYLFTIILGLPIIALWGAIIAGNVISAGVGYLWIQSTLRTFNFREVEETVHMHA